MLQILTALLNLNLNRMTPHQKERNARKRRLHNLRSLQIPRKARKRRRKRRGSPRKRRKKVGSQGIRRKEMSRRRKPSLTDYWTWHIMEKPGKMVPRAVKRGDLDLGLKTKAIGVADKKTEVEVMIEKARGTKVTVLRILIGLVESIVWIIGGGRTTWVAVEILVTTVTTLGAQEIRVVNGWRVGMKTGIGTTTGARISTMATLDRSEMTDPTRMSETEGEMSLSVIARIRIGGKGAEMIIVTGMMTEGRIIMMVITGGDETMKRRIKSGARVMLAGTIGMKTEDVGAVGMRTEEMAIEKRASEIEILGETEGVEELGVDGEEM